MKRMNPADLSKVFHCARLVIDGTFKAQHAARKALGMPISMAGRISDAHTLLMHGAPELIAAVESGQLAFQTGWQAARILDRNKQLEVLHRATSNHHTLTNTGHQERHGLYTGRKSQAELGRAALKQHGRVCESVDKLLDAIVERMDALGVCTEQVQPMPESEQAKKWRRSLNRCRRALTALEKRIDWTRIETNHIEHIEHSTEGDGQNDPSTAINNDGPQD